MIVVLVLVVFVAVVILAAEKSAEVELSTRNKNRPRASKQRDSRADTRIPVRKATIGLSCGGKSGGRSASATSRSEKTVVRERSDQTKLLGLEEGLRQGQGRPGRVVLCCTVH